MAIHEDKPLQFRPDERDVWREIFRFALAEIEPRMRPREAMQFADDYILALRERMPQPAETPAQVPEPHPFSGHA